MNKLKIGESVVVLGGGPGSGRRKLDAPSAKFSRDHYDKLKEELKSLREQYDEHDANNPGAQSALLKRIEKVSKEMDAIVTFRNNMRPSSKTKPKLRK